MQIVKFLFPTLFLFVSFSTLAVTSNKCPGEAGYSYTNDRNRNPTPGGFVSNGAHVSENSFVAPTAAVCGSAMVESSRLLGESVVAGNSYIENSILMGNTIIDGDATVIDSRLRGYHYYNTGEIVNIKTFKKKSSAQINSEKAQASAQKNNREREIRREISQIESNTLTMRDICVKRYGECVWERPEREATSVGTIIYQLNRTGKSLEQYYTAGGHRLNKDAHSKFRRYQSQINDLKRQLKNL
jgi:uncharacterized protein YaiI (UPF0178 family)